MTRSKFILQSRHRIDGVWTIWLIQFDSRNSETLIVLSRQRQHRIAMKRRRDSSAALMRRHARRHEDYFIKFKELTNPPRHFEVAVVHGVEGTTINRCTPPNHHPI